MADVLLIGCGELALPLGKAFAAAKCGVAATTTDVEAAKALAAAGIQPIDADVERPETLDGIAESFDIVCLRPGIQADAAARTVLQSLPFELHRFILLSSVELYGRTDGSWVDETSELRPPDEPARLLAAAEKMCLGAFRTQAVPTVVLRLGQIAAESATAGPERWVNRIGTEDAVRAIVAAAENEVAGEIINVVDGAPVLTRAAGGTSQRIGNAKLIAKLGFTPQRVPDP